MKAKALSSTPPQPAAVDLSISIAKDPLCKPNAERSNVIWVAYPDIKAGVRLHIYTASGHLYCYISLRDAARFTANPTDNRNLKVHFQRNWLDDERLSVVRTNSLRTLEIELHYWDKCLPQT